jgi:Zn-dependent protease with chaperone function
MVSSERGIYGKFYSARQSRAHPARLSVSHDGQRYRLHVERTDVAGETAAGVAAEQTETHDQEGSLERSREHPREQRREQPKEHTEEDKAEHKAEHKEEYKEAHKTEYTGEVTSLDVPSRLAHTQRRIGFADGSAFITQDNDAVDALLAHSHTQLTSSIHALEGSFRAVALGLLVLIAGVYLGVTQGIPWAAERVATQIPQDVQNRLGRDALVILDRIMLEPSELEPAEEERLRRLAMPALVAAGFADTDLQFRKGIGPNALTLPDGTIVITDELAVLASDDQLLAVVYHELGHLEGRHILRRTLQNSFLVLGVFFLTGDVNSVELLLAIPTVVMNSAYSRDFEREADRYALEKLIANEIPIDSFAQIMTAFEEVAQRQRIIVIDDEPRDELNQDATKTSAEEEDLEDTLLNYFMTHPQTSERIALVEEYRELEQARQSER